MLPLWEISSIPRCEHHVFLSHCAEDRGWLVNPLYEHLAAARVIPWIDRHDYPLGTDPFEALREGVLKCRHMVFLITLAMLDQGRGWANLEKCYAGILQDNLRLESMELAHVELPLFFVPRNHPVLARSIWAPVATRGSTHLHHHGDPVVWAAGEIRRFVETEQRRGAELGIDLENDSRFLERVTARRGLIDRVRLTYPMLEPLPRDDPMTP